jgi:hypothetical protein
MDSIEIGSSGGCKARLLSSLRCGSVHSVSFNGPWTDWLSTPRTANGSEYDLGRFIPTPENALVGVRIKFTLLGSFRIVANHYTHSSKVISYIEIKY